MTEAEKRCRANIESVLSGSESDPEIVWSLVNDYTPTEMARAETCVKDNASKWLSRIAVAVGALTIEERVETLESK
jgi:hypothetical protein